MPWPVVVVSVKLSLGLAMAMINTPSANILSQKGTGTSLVFHVLVFLISRVVDNAIVADFLAWRL
jgi:hypothetical protein